MKRFATTIAVLLLFATARAQKVDANDAQYAATNYLTAARLLSPDNLVSLSHLFRQQQ